MQELISQKNKYFNGDIIKSEYMERMNMSHNILFQYNDLIKESNVKKIEIDNKNVIVETDKGIKLLCIKNDRGLIPFTMLNFGKYEETLWDKTMTLVDNPSVIFDIGGNIGYFSLYWSLKYPNSQFYCFEPVPNNFNILSQHLKMNDTKNIKAYNIGLSNKKMTEKMFYNPEGCGSSSLKNLLENKNTKEVYCEFNTLDDFVKENKIEKIDFIKCDVEGAEKFVYEGGLKTLEKYKPVIYSEMLRKWAAKFNYHPNDIIKLLKPLGYECYAISEETYNKITGVTEETIETNFIFINKD